MIIFVANNVSAQWGSTVPYQSLINVNPSFAGSNGNMRNQTLLYSQKELFTNYTTFNNTFDAYLSGLKSGVSLKTNYSSDNGSQKSTSGSVSYSKYFLIGNNLKIIPSLQLGYTVQELNLGSHSTSIFIVPGTNSSWVRSEYFSLSSGLLVNYKNFYVGMSVFNLNRPDIGFFDSYRTPALYRLHASYNIKVSDNFLLNLFGQIDKQNNYYNSLLAMNVLCFKHLIYGVGFQSKTFASMNAGYRSNYFTVQLGCNWNINGWISESPGDSWQLMLSFNLRNKELRNSLTNFEAW